MRHFKVVLTAEIILLGMARRYVAMYIATYDVCSYVTAWWITTSYVYNYVINLNLKNK